MLRRLPARKLLIASIGVAAVSYVACAKTDQQPPGNLMPPVTADAQEIPVVGNLMPAPVPEAGAADSSKASLPTMSPTPDAAATHHIVGNLMPPPRRDSGL